MQNLKPTHSDHLFRKLFSTLFYLLFQIFTKIGQTNFLKAMCEYVYIERMLMSARCYSIAHAYGSIFQIYLQFVFIL